MLPTTNCVEDVVDTTVDIAEAVVEVTCCVDDAVVDKKKSVVVVGCVTLIKGLY